MQLPKCHCTTRLLTNKAIESEHNYLVSVELPSADRSPSSPISIITDLHHHRSPSSSISIITDLLHHRSLSSPVSFIIDLHHRSPPSPIFFITNLLQHRSPSSQVSFITDLVTEVTCCSVYIQSTALHQCSFVRGHRKSRAVCVHSSSLPSTV